MIFGHFWDGKKLNLVKKIFFVKLIYLTSRVFFGVDFFKFSGSLWNNRARIFRYPTQWPDPSLLVGKCISSIKTKWERHLRKDMVYHGPLETNSESRLVANSCMKVNKATMFWYIREGKRALLYSVVLPQNTQKKLKYFVLQKFMMNSAFLGFEVLII